jgi:hypothetical protein
MCEPGQVVLVLAVAAAGRLLRAGDQAMSTTAPTNGRPATASVPRGVKVRGYKSLVNCDVELGPLTVLVGAAAGAAVR